MKFFAVTNMMADYQTPVACERVEPLGNGGWIGFWIEDRLVLAVSPEYFFFQEIDEEEYSEAVEIIQKIEESGDSNE